MGKGTLSGYIFCSTKDPVPKNLTDRCESSTGHLGQSNLDRTAGYDCSHLATWVASNHPSGHRYHWKMSLLQ